MRSAKLLLLAAPLAVALSLSSVGCDEGLPSDTTSSSSSSSSSSTSSSSTSSSTSSSSGMDGGPDCFMNPTTHVEIINACTDAEKVDKVVVLPLLGPDGGLPPLP